jgi:hypothetical protein
MQVGMGLKVLPIEGPTKLAKKKKATFSFLSLFAPCRWTGLIQTKNSSAQHSTLLSLHPLSKTAIVSNASLLAFYQNSPAKMLACFQADRSSQ